MAFVFQSNPKQWDLHKHLIPGNEALWYVSRYESLIREGALVLLWEAKGSREAKYAGLYGWAVATDDPKKDEQGTLRIRIKYIERWCVEDVANVSEAVQTAPIPAAEVWEKLASWEDHLLKIMPFGTIFTTTQGQVKELVEKVVTTRFPRSQFPMAAELDARGKRINWNEFEPNIWVAEE